MRRFTLILLLLVCSLLLTGCKDLVRMDGDSMAPTLHQDDIVQTVPYDSTDDIARFDIILLQNPHNEYLMIKRVIGLPGDLVEIQDGVVYINSERQDEPYIAPENRQKENYGPVTVPDGHIFVLGDNRSNSHDSRYESYGMLPLDHVISKVTEIVDTAFTPAP